MQDCHDVEELTATNRQILPEHTVFNSQNAFLPVILSGHISKQDTFGGVLVTMVLSKVSFPSLDGDLTFFLVSETLLAALIDLGFSNATFSKSIS